MKNLVVALLPLLLFACGNPKSVSVLSPDGKIKVDFWIDETSDNHYSVSYEGETIVLPSFIGYQLEDESKIGDNVEIVSFSEMEVNQSWKPVYGELAEVPDTYNQTTIRLKETTEQSREFEIALRVYNEGVAFNTTFLSGENEEQFTIQKELTEFTFNEDYDCWVSDRAQSEYRNVPIGSIKEPAERPLVVEAGNKYLAVGEAKLIDFSRMKLQSGENNNSLIAALEDSPEVELPYTTPWRTIMIGSTPGELLENNYFLQNLNDPCAIEDVSWIKPGKVIREVTLTTRGGIACVDFAAANGLQYIEFDAGWYGNEYEETSDATTITVDPKRSPGPLDLQKVIDYGKSKGIGVILYVNRRALEKQIDEILPLYKSWGIKGVKYGFVQVGSQEWTAWLHEAVKKAADNQLMVDIHDEYRPTGFSRTYPNLMTQEGIRGDEESPTNEHTLITLFTRMLAGAGDNTICYFAPRVTETMGGHVSQLAKAVMMYSPWQFLFWYDRPPNSSDVIGGVPGAKDYIEVTPELEFFKQMPTVWDDTKVLEGKISEYATIARKSGDDWFLGSLTGEQAHSFSFDLTFLDDNTDYQATIYTYDPNSKSKTKVNIEKRDVNVNSKLQSKIEANSGLAIHFQKK
ncbi:glycoside hydrolase family 97 protein [Maribellus maritimus]|uniref:glycoside hydrolase family 97 protein n=1 Tax=Maribellus maritimus TaxID=2870838 RepID=UPI001EEB0280|nr:glycoside hydrolase family 97 protein [Maribellus maritimus]MCG6191054.1 glycoside hydrolase family 97 protein [Maribellus maritimus]